MIRLTLISTLLLSITPSLADRDYRRCVNYVSEKYDEVFSSSYARKKAQEDCEYASFKTLVFSYPKYRESYTVQYSMKKAVKLANDLDIRGYKRQMEFAFRVYDEDYTTSYAMKKTIDIAEELSLVSFRCLRDEYNHFRSDYTNSYAFKKALKYCLGE